MFHELIKPQVELESKENLNLGLVSPSVALCDIQPMNTKLGLNIKNRLEDLDKTQMWLAEKVGVSNNAVTKWIATGKISRDSAVKAASALGLSIDQLLGDGAPHSANQSIAMYDAPKRADDDAYQVPQYREVMGAMGRGVMLRDQPGQIVGLRVTKEWLHKNVPSNTGHENLCVVTGFGDSMKGMYNPGDPLLVDTGVKSCDYDGVYFFRIGDEGFIKRLQRIPGVGIKVISENKVYETWTITPDMDFEVFAKVLKVWESTDF